MQIGIDARLWEEPRSGIGRYTRSLVEAMVRVAPGERWILYTDHPLGALPPGCETRCLPEHRRLVWTLRDLPRALARDDLDLYHSVTGFELPLRAKPRLVTTVHDLIPLRFRAAVPWRHRWAVRALMGGALRRAERVIAVSEATREEILARYHLPGAKVRVVCEAADPRFGAAGHEARAAARERYGLRDPYFLFVGLIEPKKNLETLLRATAILAARGELGSWRLLIAGASGWGEARLESLARELGIAEAVRMLGAVPDADLPALYAEAGAFVFPSLWEGFGLPVVEAMASGTPVIASSRGALPEVTGGAALLVEPAPEPLAAAMASLITDGALRARLAEAGRARAATFSWDRAARETLAVYREAAG